MGMEVPIYSSTQSSPDAYAYKDSFGPSGTHFIATDSHSYVASGPASYTCFVTTYDTVTPTTFAIPTSGLYKDSTCFTLSQIASSVVSPPREGNNVFFGDFFFPCGAPVPVNPGVLYPRGTGGSTSDSYALANVYKILYTPSAAAVTFFSYTVTTVSLAKFAHPDALRVYIVTAVFIFSMVYSFA